MKKILFLIHDLGQGGAEKVLVNLLNHLDRQKFEITVMALFGGGVNEQFLSRDIRLINCHKKAVPGNSHLMKLFTPRQLYRHYIREHYDIIVSYLEGPSARIVSGCTDPHTRLVSWIHIEQKTPKRAAASFRTYAESLDCYQRFHRTICVSDTVRQDFLRLYPVDHPVEVLYNTNDSARIIAAAAEEIPAHILSDQAFRLIGVGKILPSKGFDRIARIHKRLREDGYPVHTYILGTGPQQSQIQQYLEEHDLTDSYTFLGYQTNPYKYVANCDLFLCASHAEGFSTAATEALIVGTPVCTVEVSGMKEMLGEHNEWGIVTGNQEEALYQGIKKLLDDPALLAHYKEKAAQRGSTFRTEHTVRAVEHMLEHL